MKNKLIIMLSAKRCGSTAIFKIFQQNKFCKIAIIIKILITGKYNFGEISNFKRKDYQLEKIKIMSSK